MIELDNMIWDIIVIGAGPAGSTFAKEISKLNKTVLVIDGQTAEKSKPCGGLLAPDAQKLLAHSDMILPKDVLVDPQIFSVKTMDLGTGLTRYYQRYYMNMDRYAFDLHLMSLIPENICITEGRCTGIAQDDGLFNVQVHQYGDIAQFKCRNIVGADGASSIVRRKFFPDRSISRYTAIQQWFAYDGQEKPFYSCIFDRETSDSCSWTIHKDGYLLYGGCFKSEGCREAFELQKERFEAFSGIELNEPILTEACQACRPKHLRDFVTGENHIFLIGEAAGFISPSSFEGISSAMFSGKALAEAFANSNATASYSRKVRRLKYKLYFKTWKRAFMYTPWTRKLIMKSGISSIKVSEKQENYEDDQY